MDRARLIKVMSLTTSDSDGEALAALRMANKMLASEKLTWGEILAVGAPSVRISIHRNQPTPYKAEENWVAPHLKDPTIIEMMFRTIYGTPMSDQFREVMDSVHRHWTTNHSVSPNQYQALRKCYQRARNA